MPPVTARWEQLPELLAAVINGAVPVWADPVWHDLAAVLASYRAWRGGQHAQARRVASALDGVLGRGLRQWYDRLDAHGADRTPIHVGMAGGPATGGARS
jgi:thymidylate synthase